MTIMRTAKLLGLLTLTGVVGFTSLKFIPQSTALSNLQGATATFESDSDQKPSVLYAYDSYLDSHSTKINVRSGPGTNYAVNYVVSNGDGVTLLNDAIGNDGYRWYYSRFDRYAFTGWIREDLLFIPNDLQEAAYEKDHHGHELPEQYVTLHSGYPNSKINVRRGPGTNYGIRHYGLNGDPVSILDSSSGKDGFIWYELTFVNSGAKGWVREDLLAFIAD